MLVIGDGSLRRKLNDYSKEIGINKNVSFVGKVSQKKMVEFLNKCHLFVSFSTSDGDVVSMVEAMACHLFCIGSDIPANHFWITQNKNGFLIPLNEVDKLADAIINVKNDYLRLTKQAIEFNIEIINNKGNWNSNMQKAQALYNGLLK